MPRTSVERPCGALVVGGAKGIGRAITRVLAARGDTVVVADSDGAAGTALVTELRGAGLAARFEELDVTDVERVRAVVAAADAESPLGTVVASAGIAFARRIEDVEPVEYDHLMAVNVRGVFFVVQAAVRAMSPRGRGTIVTVCSTSGFTASTAPMTVYDASKGAVRLLTQAAAREVAATGLRINAVAPGTVETDLTLGLSSSDELAALGRSRVPLGRLGRPDEIADAVAFLSSDESSYVTGHILVVDGGWLA